MSYLAKPLPELTISGVSASPRQVANTYLFNEFQTPDHLEDWLRYGRRRISMFRVRHAARGAFLATALSVLHDLKLLLVRRRPPTCFPFLC